MMESSGLATKGGSSSGYAPDTFTLSEGWAASAMCRMPGLCLVSGRRKVMTCFNDSGCLLKVKMLIVPLSVDGMRTLSRETKQNVSQYSSQGVEFIC